MNEELFSEELYDELVELEPGVTNGLCHPADLPAAWRPDHSPERLEEWRSYRPGSDEDFDRLYQASYSRLLFTVQGILGDYAAAEDCIQDAFIRAYRTWGDWRPDAPPEAWLHRIALNVAFSYCRWRRLRQVGDVIRRIGLPKPEPDPEEASLRTDLMQALRRLPAQQAAIVLLRHYHGYSNREIAHVLSLPESTVASRLAAAKERLRAELS